MIITAARYQQLKDGAPFASDEERAQFAEIKEWERRSWSAKQAVKTKRLRYTRWPTRARDHKRRIP